MAKLRNWLSGLLVLQLLVAAGLYWNTYAGNSGGAPGALFSFDRDTVNRVVIDDDKQSVTLAKQNGHWVLPEQHSLPVDEALLNGVLEKAQALKTGWPVATTAAARERFAVADDKFERRLQVYQGEQRVADLLLGTSPGFRQTHIRKAGDDAIYSAGLNSYELMTNADAWLDKTLLSARDIEAIKGSDFDLHKGADGWVFAGGTEEAGDGQQSPDKGSADALADALGNLRVLSLSDKPLDQPAATLEVSSGTQRWNYRFGSGEGRYLVARSDIDGVFNISEDDYKKITQPDKLTLAAGADGADKGGPAADTDESHG